MDYEIRRMEPNEWPLLEDFLYEAIYVPEDFEGEVPRSIIYEDPMCRAAFEGFGSRPDDRAVVIRCDSNGVSHETTKRQLWGHHGFSHDLLPYSILV